MGESLLQTMDYVWKTWEKKIIEAADPRLKGKLERKGMERMLVVGLLCVHPHHEKRPMAKDAVRMLRGEIPLPPMPGSKPRVRIRPALHGDNREELDIVGHKLSGFDNGPYIYDTKEL